jgi:hypothetical protein
MLQIELITKNVKNILVENVLLFKYQLPYEHEHDGPYSYLECKSSYAVHYLSFTLLLWAIKMFQKGTCFSLLEFQEYFRL